MPHTTQDTAPDVEREAPTTPGWYRTTDGANWLLFALDERGQWSAHVLNGDATPCVWSYIDQGGPVELVTPFGALR